MLMKPTCLIVWLAIMAGIQGDTIMRVQGEANYMEKMILKDLTNLLEDIPQLRMKRDTVCDSLQNEMMTCIHDAIKQFDSEWEVEVDKIPENEIKPDYHARKTCNFLTAATQDCLAILLETCEFAEGNQVMQNLTDELIKNMLQLVEEADVNFDPQKCPITKDYLEQNSVKSLTASLLLVIVSVGIVCRG